jgi:hypothetical protein
MYNHLKKINFWRINHESKIMENEQTSNNI